MRRYLAGSRTLKRGMNITKHRELACRRTKRSQEDGRTISLIFRGVRQQKQRGFHHKQRHLGVQHNRRGEVREQRKQHCRQGQDWSKVESDGVRKLVEHDEWATLRKKIRKKKIGSDNEQH